MERDNNDESGHLLKKRIRKRPMHDFGGIDSSPS